jgi:CheY-like chemotaxis protein
MFENTPDCLILDSHLPGLSGADVARTLSSRCPDIPIIGITARPGSKLANEVQSAGANVMLTKPVSAERIVSKLQAVMA